MPKAPCAAAAAEQRRGVAREAAIMRLLAGHPAAVELVEAVETGSSFVLVMELVRGGELFEQIVRRCAFLCFVCFGALVCAFVVQSARVLCAVCVCSVSRTAARRYPPPAPALLMWVPTQ